MNDGTGKEPFVESARRHQTPDELAASIAVTDAVKALLARLDERLTDEVPPDTGAMQATRGG